MLGERIIETSVKIGLCPVCKEDINYTASDSAYEEAVEHIMIGQYGVCGGCRKKYLGDGIMLINPDTGSWVVMRTSAFTRDFERPIPDGRIMKVEEKLINKMVMGGMKVKHV